jgi:hypothetical protein
MSVGPIIRLRFGRPGTHGLPRHIAGLRVIAVVAGITANAANAVIRFRSGLVQLVRLSLNSRGLPRLRQLTPRSPGLVRRLAAGSVGTVSIFSAISRARLTRLGLSRVRLSRGGRLGGHRALHGLFSRVRPFGLVRLAELTRLTLTDHGSRLGQPLRVRIGLTGLGPLTPGLVGRGRRFVPRALRLVRLELGRLDRHRALDGFIRPFGLARLVRLARLIDYGNRPRPDGPIPHDIDCRSPSALLRPPSLHRTLINEGDHGYVFSPLLIGRGQCAAVADVGLELLEVVLR